MKNLKSLFLSVLGLAAILSITSCGEDDPITAALPSVVVTATVNDAALANGGDVEVGSTINWKIDITAPGGVNGLNVTSGSTTSYSRDQLGAQAGDTQGTINLSSEIQSNATVGAEGSVTFQAVDDLGQTTDVVFTYTIVAPPSPAAKVQTAIILSAPDADGLRDAFYSVGQNLLYSHSDVVGTSAAVSQNIDFAYYYGNSDEASLVSPSEYPSAVFDISAWGTRNETAMVQLVDFSSEDFMALTTVQDVVDVFEGLGEDVELVAGFSGLEVGTVIAFETAGEINGILIVKSLTAGFSGSIELEMILAEPAQAEVQ